MLLKSFLKPKRMLFRYKADEIDFFRNEAGEKLNVTLEEDFISLIKHAPALIASSATSDFVVSIEILVSGCSK